MNRTRRESSNGNGATFDAPFDRRYDDPHPTRGAMNWIASTAARFQDQMRPLGHDAAHRVSSGIHDATQSGTRWVTDSGHQLARESSRAARRAVGQVRQRPVTAMLAAAAAGALLYAVVTSVMGSGRR